ncbi:MAG: magnesium/cobalt transporter CorA [Pararhodobacter sp.]|nr:magnesium/cobalt transporter CorA [Pararhodobacter sp.]
MRGLAGGRAGRAKRSIVTRRRMPPGTAPGTLSVDPAATPSRIEVIAASADRVRGPDPVAPGALPMADPAVGVLWVNVEGLGDHDALSAVAGAFNLHPLAIEDAINLHQRPKFEDYESHHFVVLRMPQPPGAETVAFVTEQLAICFGPGFVVTLQERPGDVFAPVRHRLLNEAGQMRSRGADYLSYALIDAVVDAYFPVLEALGERVEALEAAVIRVPEAAHVAEIHALKHELMMLRRAVWPMRDMLAAMLRDDSALITDHTRLYLRDCHDHAIQLIELIESYREIASGLIDIHLSSIANRTNEVMRLLTLIATIFIPLTFVAGVYGMNFNPEAGWWNMPELNWRFGYPAVLAGMLALALGLVWWFRRKGWIGRG